LHFNNTLQAAFKLSNAARANARAAMQMASLGSPSSSSCHDAADPGGEQQQHQELLQELADHMMQFAMCQARAAVALAKQAAQVHKAATMSGGTICPLQGCPHPPAPRLQPAESIDAADVDSEDEVASSIAPQHQLMTPADQLD
jgi:hypothetical protein